MLSLQLNKILAPLFAWFVVATATVAEPACQGLAPSQTVLNLPSANLTVPGNPFAIVYMNDNIAFASFGGSLGVLDTSQFAPTLLHNIALPKALTGDEGVLGMSINKAKSLLFLAANTGAIVVNATLAQSGSSSAIVGVLNGTSGTSAIQVTLSQHEDFAFVSQEYGVSNKGQGNVEVFKLQYASDGSVSGTSLGDVALGEAVVGTALSPDGSKLYGLSEVGNSTVLNQTDGSLTVLDVPTLIKTPAQSILYAVAAGCQPVRVALGPAGEHVWVTARASNSLLAFDTTALNSHTTAQGSLVASVQVGQAPVGLDFINDGQHVVTADSNRFNITGGVSGITIVDIKSALGGAQGFPRVPTGLFPRQFGVSPDNQTLFVAQFDSHAIQALNVESLATPTGGSWSNYVRL